LEQQAALSNGGPMNRHFLSGLIIAAATLTGSGIA
jgi:hypothetical protein